VRGIKIFQKLFKERINRATEHTLDELMRSTSNRHRDEITDALSRLAREQGAKVRLGTTDWGQDVQLSLDQIATHGLVLGASGAGKSYFALSLISQILEAATSPAPVSFGILDAKGELFETAIKYLYAYIYRLKPSEREALRKRIFTIDFSNAALVAPYNILAHQEYVADEIMVASRIETISEQFSGLSEISVRMKQILKNALLLMVEFSLPLPFFEKLFTDPLLLNLLVEKSKNPQVKDYFENRFDDESKSTLLALRQRIDALLISEGVRLSLSASSAPDFKAFQDQGAIVLINTAGRNITRGISDLLQGLILSDIKQSVFRRSNPNQKFIWFFDEAQNLYKTAANREHMIDLLTMARSFGSQFVLLTQSLTSAVRDQDILNSILANVRWMVMLRSTLRDAELISPSIHLTVTRAKPKHNPFEPARLMSESEELKTNLKEVTKFPDRIAYCWLKAYLHWAIKIATPQLPPPCEIAGCNAQVFNQFMASEGIGQGIAKMEVAKQITAREKNLRQMMRPGAVSPRGSDAANPKGKGGQNLTRLLEEEYGKRKA